MGNWKKMGQSWPKGSTFSWGQLLLPTKQQLQLSRSGSKTLYSKGLPFLSWNIQFLFLKEQKALKSHLKIVMLYISHWIIRIHTVKSTEPLWKYKRLLPWNLYLEFSIIFPPLILFMYLWKLIDDLCTKLKTTKLKITWNVQKTRL